jgi:NAD(P)-dependent dehydrogenase (short-subunit alcohol dehydrogenase family)
VTQALVVGASSDIGGAVAVELARFVVTFPARGCPTEIHLEPQRTP